jgi:hypothetical protein
VGGHKSSIGCVGISGLETSSIKGGGVCWNAAHVGDERDIYRTSRVIDLH